MQIRHRLFFGIKPPRIVADDMAALPSRAGWDRRSNRADRLHMTLALTPDFSDMPQNAIDALCAIGNAVAAEPFRLVFDRAVATHNRVILLASERLPQAERFQQQLVHAIASAGLPRRKNVRFNPHITLSYQHGAPFDRPIDPYSWQVEEFVLIHSHVGLTLHDLAGQWTLGGNSSAATNSLPKLANQILF
ncbi:MAG: 2'-5' RNA ligase family protein [Sphingomonadales bacterium]|jgi:2'-5' RNA ligase|nr:2'-5' RNA ligase family protein [Sphingomonadales bacterium]